MLQSEPNVNEPEVLSPEALADRVARVRERIADAAVKSGRRAEDVILVAVSKRHPARAAANLLAAGHAVLGENYVQEALAKQEALAGRGAQWHFIGRLQKNKAKFVAGRFALMHTLDSIELARALHKRALAEGVVQEVLLQINLARERQKAGAAEEDAERLAEDVLGLDGLGLKGLMVMPPFDSDPEKSRPYFAGLRGLRDELERRLGVRLPFLSMGMSGDLEQAAAEGATHVRVGTAIFGPRPPLA